MRHLLLVALLGSIICVATGCATANDPTTQAAPAPGTDAVKDQGKADPTKGPGAHPPADTAVK